MECQSWPFHETWVCALLVVRQDEVPHDRIDLILPLPAREDTVMSDTDLQIPSNALLFLVLTAVVSRIGSREVELMKNDLENEQ